MSNSKYNIVPVLDYDSCPNKLHIGPYTVL